MAHRWIVSALIALGLAPNAWAGNLVSGDGPAPHRGVELTPEVADGPNSAILDQVSNGLAVRMAVLYLVSGKSS